MFSLVLKLNKWRELRNAFSEILLGFIYIYMVAVMLIVFFKIIIV